VKEAVKIADDHHGGRWNDGENEDHQEELLHRLDVARGPNTSHAREKALLRSQAPLASWLADFSGLRAVVLLRRAEAFSLETALNAVEIKALQETRYTLLC
jgi:hypothetical protein